jgi:hypothetical protein
MAAPVSDGHHLVAVDGGVFTYPATNGPPLGAITIRRIHVLRTHCFHDRDAGAGTKVPDRGS